MYTHLINICLLSMSLCQAGGYPAADSLTVTSFPQLGQVLASMHDHAGEGTAPFLFGFGYQRGVNTHCSG